MPRSAQVTLRYVLFLVLFTKLWVTVCPEEKGFTARIIRGFPRFKKEDNKKQSSLSSCSAVYPIGGILAAARVFMPMALKV